MKRLNADACQQFFLISSSTALSLVFLIHVTAELQGLEEKGTGSEPYARRYQHQGSRKASESQVAENSRGAVQAIKLAKSLRVWVSQQLGRVGAPSRCRSKTQVDFGVFRCGLHEAENFGQIRTGTA
jgi:hypothetical protein